MSKEWRKSFSNKLLNFGVKIIKLANKLPKTPAGFAIASQLVKSGISIGANFFEAQDASSRPDFINKMSISLREARETAYWLDLIKLSDMLNGKDLDEAIIECQEIIAILAKSVKSSKSNFKK